MQKIFINDKEATIEELVEFFTDTDGEIDFDALGFGLDSDILDAAISSFDGCYGVEELIERYLSLADNPIYF